MVGLVLHDAGDESGRLALDRRAVDVEAAEAEAGGAADCAAQAGDGQAAFPGEVRLLPHLLELGVDQGGDAPCPGPPDEQAQRHMDLRGGEADAPGILQRFGHVGDQAPDLGRGGVRDLLRAAEEDGVAHAGDLEEGHDAPAVENLLRSTHIGAVGRMRGLPARYESMLHAAAKRTG